jgi:hypothetical protein
VTNLFSIVGLGTPTTATELSRLLDYVACDSVGEGYVRQQLQFHLHMKCIDRCLDVELQFLARALHRTRHH